MHYHVGMFGSHLSIAGGLHNALLEAQQLKMSCVQVFTKNQRQWQVKPLTNEQIDLWHKTRTQTKIRQVVSHDSYLINLASPDPENWKKSKSLFREELLRCETLKIPFLVTHPGAHMRQGEDWGLARVAKALNQLHKQLPGLKVITCLEVTAGQGTALGYRFEHLRKIIDLTTQPQRLAVCLDTAHMLAAGYELTSAAGCRRVIAELTDTIGLDLVQVIHLNDSKVPRGKRVDRHEHIGHGHIPLSAFRELVNHHHFRSIPKILETAKEVSPDGRPWDIVNLATLDQLGKRPTKRNLNTQKRIKV